MYLSRVEIAINNQQKAKELMQLSTFHNWVEQSFPDEIKTKQQLLHLWRIDHLAGKSYLLIVSKNKPNSNQLLRYGVMGTIAVKDYDDFLSKIMPEQSMHFCLTANPAVKANQDGKLVPCTTVSEQTQWLLDQAQQAGFEVNRDDFKIVARDWPILFHKKGRRIRLSRVTFEGILHVKDVNLFKQTMTNGIGLEKTFGMGLMTATPISK